MAMNVIKLGWKGMCCMLVCLLMAAGGMAQTGPLTETEIRAFIAGLEQAIRQQDIPAIEAALAEDVIIHFEVKSEQGDESLQFNRDQYIASLQTVMSELLDYQARVQIQAIEIADGGDTAQVRLQVWERLVWPEQQQESIAIENLSLRRGDSGLVVELILGRVQIAKPLQNVSLPVVQSVPGVRLP